MKKNIFLVLYLLMIVLNGFAQPLIIAHRGASYDAPENTLAAVNLAWKNGADAVEVDVHQSRDGRIMAIHDKDTKRTASKKLKVAATSSDELRKLDVGSFKSEKYANEKIPFLEEVIKTIPSEKTLFVEIKSDESLLPALKDIIHQSGKSDQIVIIGFDFDTMESAKQMMPGIPVYWLKYSLIRYNDKLIERAKAANLDGLNLHYKNITEAFANKTKAAGLELFSWTVDDPVEAKRLKALGINGITTNRPAWLKQKMMN